MSEILSDSFHQWLTATVGMNFGTKKVILM